MLKVMNLRCGYRRHAVLDGVSFTLSGGELLCLLGPNGVGKTTLFKTVLGLLPALGGEVRLDGEAIANWPRRRLAQWMGYVPQAHTPPFPFEVRDVVAMGRTAHLGFGAAPDQNDRAIAEAAMSDVGIAALADARYTEISGGERQLALIARALAQQPRLLVMDEPTSNLDYGNQLRVLAHVRRIVNQRGMGVILTTHHPDHALTYATRVLALDGGKRWSVGLPHEVINADYLRRAYGVEAEIHELKRRDGSLSRWCVPDFLDAGQAQPSSFPSG